eukprot:11198776-Lingulodinium_polyedra.AAC.1
MLARARAPVWPIVARDATKSSNTSPRLALQSCTIIPLDSDSWRVQAREPEVRFRVALTRNSGRTPRRPPPPRQT